jgi:hypothetical protein
MKRNLIFLILCLGLAILSGCETYDGTSFAPLEPRLESTGYGGAQTIGLVNSSGQTLHNLRFRAYTWGQSQLVNASQAPYVLASASGLPQRIPAQTYILSGSAGKLAPADVLHFRNADTGGEGRLLLPVTKVQITGNCDEGTFRETWVMSGGGQLELVGVPQD